MHAILSLYPCPERGSFFCATPQPHRTGCSRAGDSDYSRGTYFAFPTSSAGSQAPIWGFGRDQATQRPPHDQASRGPPSRRCTWGQYPARPTTRPPENPLTRVGNPFQRTEAAMALTAKQKAFVREYIIDKNASAAARRAGYSPKTAGYIGHENLKKPEIAAEIEAALATEAEKASLSVQEVIDGLRREAHGQGPDTSASARIAALKALGDYLDVWSSQKHEITLKKNPRDMSDEELMQALHALGPS